MMTQFRLISITIISFFLALAIGIGFVYSLEQGRRADRRQATTLIAASQADSIQRQLNLSLSSTFALASLLRQFKAIEDFDTIAADMIESYGGISNLQLAPNGVIAQVYPQSGYEHLIGLDVLSDPQSQNEARAAIESKALTIGRSFETHEGEMSLVGRLPIFLPDDAGRERFWGFVIAVVSVSDLVKASTLNQLPNQGYDFELSFVDVNEGSRISFARSTTTELLQPLLYDFELSNGMWVLAIAEKNPPQFFASLLGIALVVMMSLLVSALSYALIKQPILLRRKVRFRTRELLDANRKLEIEISERKQMQGALQESERRYQQIVEEASDVVYTADVRGYFTYVNPLVNKLTEYSEEEIIGTHFTELIVDGWKKRAQVFYFRQFADRIRETLFEFPITTKSGKEKWVEQTVSLLTNDDQVSGFQAIVRDITDRKRAEQALLQLSRQNEMILNAAGEGIYGLDSQGKTTFINPAAARMLGWEVTELLDKPPHDIVHHTKPDGTPYPLKQCPIYEALKDGSAHHVDDEVFWRKDGAYFPVEYISTPIQDEHGELAGAVVVFQDISERKQLEEMKAEFVSNVSHELRTPLTSIKGYVELLLSKDGSNLNPQQIEFLNILAKNTERLTNLIGDLLDIEGMDSEKAEFQFKTLNLNDVLDAVVQTVQINAEEKGLGLITNLQADIALQGDEAKLIQAFTNLISNAIKYTVQGTISVCTHFEAKQKQAIVSIADTGIGIAPEDLKHVFDRFFRTSHDYVRKVGGTGLGLAIAKVTIEKHQGEIEVQSELGKGTTFIVRLPAGCETPY